MIRIGICDDDKSIIEKTKSYIESFEEIRYEITTYCSGEELIKEKNKFDLIFLDIDMPNMDGIETAKRIREYDKSVKIIYITSYTDYTNLAFQVHAFGYLNKPVDELEIHKQLREVVSYLKEEKGEESIKFVTTEGVLQLELKDIYYFEYLDRKVYIHSKEKVYVIREKITNIAEMMEKYNFLMPHKSFVVNLLYVKSIKGYDIFMMDGSSIPLSQKKAPYFRDKLNIFLESCILL